MNAAWYKSMPDDHSKLVPPLPIPNRTVKQLCADDSAATSVKVGYRQASYMKNPSSDLVGFFFARCFFDAQLCAKIGIVFVLSMDTTRF